MTTHTPWPLELASLLRLQLAKVHQGWIFHLLVPLIVGGAIIWLKRLTGADFDSPSDASRYIAGSAAGAAMFSAMNAVSHDVADAKHDGELAYLATLPIRQWNVALALMFAPALFAAPAAVGALVVGAWAFGIDPEPSLVAPLALVAALILLAQIGTVIGLVVPHRAIGLASTALPLAVLLLTPVVVTADRAPAAMRLLGPVFPTTHAVDLFEASMVLGTTGSARSWLVLLISTMALAVVIVRLPQWHRVSPD